MKVLSGLVVRGHAIDLGLISSDGGFSLQLEAFASCDWCFFCFLFADEVVFVVRFQFAFAGKI